MNVRALLRPARRLWPQKVRTRLTLIYATLFFTAGSALLGLTYGLLASSLPTQPPAAATVNSHELSNLIRECKSARFPPKRERLVPVPPEILPACKPAEDAKLDPAETTGDPQLLERMIANLVDNAVRHNEPGGWIRLRTGTSDAAACLEIANSGPFIPDDAVPSLFEPFRRMQARAGVRDGVGLGLAIARSVVTAHRATVTARSQPAGGLDISVVIPRCLAAESQP